MSKRGCYLFGHQDKTVESVVLIVISQFAVVPLSVPHMLE